APLIHDHHHFALGLVRLHHSMRLTDLLELENARWLRLVSAGCDIIGDALQRDVGERKAGGSEHETAEEGQIDATRHLQERVEIGDRGEAAEPASQASTTAAAERVERSENGAVPEKVGPRIELLGPRKVLGQVAPFYLDALRAKLLERRDIVLAASGGDDAHARVDRHIDGRPAEGGGAAAD